MIENVVWFFFGLLCGVAGVWWVWKNIAEGIRSKCVSILQAEATNLYDIQAKAKHIKKHLIANDAGSKAQVYSSAAMLLKEMEI
jgi:hypothetical protein